MSQTTPVTTTVTVTGMTCGHCVASVREELEEITGVTDVDVTLETGQVVITSDAPLEAADIAAAVDEAGYAVA